MGEIVDKVKDKVKEVKDVVVDTAKSLPKIDILTKKFVLELNGALAMENAGIERLQTRIQEVSIPEAKQRMQRTLTKVYAPKKASATNLRVGGGAYTG